MERWVAYVCVDTLLGVGSINTAGSQPTPGRLQSWRLRVSSGWHRSRDVHHWSRQVGRRCWWRTQDARHPVWWRLLRRGKSSLFTGATLRIAWSSRQHDVHCVNLSSLPGAKCRHYNPVGESLVLAQPPDLPPHNLTSWLLLRLLDPTRVTRPDPTGMFL